MSELGAYIKARRKNLGLTQEKLRAAIGVTERSYVSRLETGNIKLPGPEIRVRLADALQVRTVDLLVAAGEIRAEELEEGNGCTLPMRVRALAWRLDELEEDRLTSLEVMVDHWLGHPVPASGSRRRSRAPRSATPQ